MGRERGGQVCRQERWRGARINVHGRTDKGEIDDLEEPRRDFSAEDGPAVVLVITSKQNVNLNV